MFSIKKSPFNEFDLLSDKTIEIFGTSNETKMQFMGWIISARKINKLLEKTLILIILDWLSIIKKYWFDIHARKN